MNKNENMTESELVAYIHQKFEDIYPLITEKSTLSAFPMEIKKVIKREKRKGEDVSRFENMSHCFVFQVKEESLIVDAYGFGNSDVEAVNDSHLLILKKLNSIQDEVVSNAERVQEINNILNSSQTRH